MIVCDVCVLCVCLQVMPQEDKVAICQELTEHTLR